MKPNAIYSKSGKGVQEASGKTSLLKRGDRAVLSAIDGRATLAEVAEKVGKPFDGAFIQLIAQLDKEGFVREVSAVAANSATSQSRPVIPAVKSAPARKDAPAPNDRTDLDFTSIMPPVRRSAPAPAAPPPRPPQVDAAAQRAKEQEATLYRARQEAEARAQAERERLRQEAEAKARTEAEAKARAEADARIRAEAEKRVREETESTLKAEFEAKARVEAEAKAQAAREAAMRIAAEAKAKAEEAERRLREEAERARREAEELRQRLEEERMAREAEERKRKEEEARARQARELEEARERAKRRGSEERTRKTQEETKTLEATLPPIAPDLLPEPAAAGGGSLDALMADLDSFSRREEDDRQAREAADRQDRDEKRRRLQEDAERRQRERAVHEERERQRAAEEARRRQEEERRAQEEAERRLREAEEARRLEAEERRRRQEALAARPKAPAADDIALTEQDVGHDDVRRDEAAVARETRKAQREREREARLRERQARERAQAAAREQPVKYTKARRSIKWGRPTAITLFMLLVVVVGALHVVPLPMNRYEDAASEALGRPVKIGAGRLSLFTGVRLNLEEVTVGGTVRIASIHAYPRIGSLIDEKKAFRRIEINGASVPQQAIGAVFAAKMRAPNFDVGRILVKNLKLEGPVPLPLFEADAVLGQDGAVRSVTLRGPDNLNARLTPGTRGEVEFDVTAAAVTVPFVPELSLASFAMKGVAHRNGMQVASWGGATLDGVVSGTASVRWAGPWQVDGVMTVRNINAAVFAPALLSEGKAEGTARFSMIGADPAKLYNGARIEGSFNVGKGALGTVDLARVLQTSGRQYGGRTPFSEMSGQAVYDRGAVTLRNVSITAGALNAGASADIAPSGALAGRIVADIRTSAQPLRAMVVLSGTVKEPQVRN